MEKKRRDEGRGKKDILVKEHWFDFKFTILNEILSIKFYRFGKKREKKLNRSPIITN